MHLRSLISIVLVSGMFPSCTSVVVSDTFRFDKTDSKTRVERTEAPLTWKTTSNDPNIELEADFKDTCTPVDDVTYNMVRERKKHLKLNGWDVAMATVFGAAGTGLLTWGLVDKNVGADVLGSGGLIIALPYIVFLTVQAIRAVDRQDVVGQDHRAEPRPAYTCNRELAETPLQLAIGGQKVRLSQDPSDRKRFWLPLAQVPREFRDALRLGGPTVSLSVNGSKVGDADLTDLYDSSWLETCFSTPMVACRQYLDSCKHCVHRKQAEETLFAAGRTKLDEDYDHTATHTWETLSAYLRACRRYQDCGHKDAVVPKLRELTSGSAQRLAFLRAQCVRWKNLGKPLCPDGLVKELADDLEVAVRAKDSAKGLVHVLGWSGSKDSYSWDVPASLRIEGKELRFIEAHRASWTTGQSFEILYVNKSTLKVRAQLVLQCYLVGQYIRMGMGEVTLSPGEMKSKAVSLKTLWGELTALQGCTYDSLLVDIVE